MALGSALMLCREPGIPVFAEPGMPVLREPGGPLLSVPIGVVFSEPGAPEPAGAPLGPEASVPAPVEEPVPPPACANACVDKAISSRVNAARPVVVCAISTSTFIITQAIEGARHDSAGRLHAAVTPILPAHNAVEMTGWYDPRMMATKTAFDPPRDARVLVADDDPAVRACLEQLLSPHCEVALVHDGAAALAALRLGRADLLLTDVTMPRMDGYMLLAAIRADETLRDTPVVLMSARTDEQARIEAVEASADDYIAKPFSSHELVARVLAQIRLARLRRSEAARERQAREEAERQRDLLRLIVDQSPTPMGVVEGHEFRFVLFNKAVEKMTGVRVEDAVGRPVAEVMPEVMGTALPYLQRVYDTGVAVHYRAEFAFATGPRYLDVVYTPMPRDPGALKRIYYSIVDLTDLESGRALAAARR